MTKLAVLLSAAVRLQTTDWPDLYTFSFSAASTPATKTLTGVASSQCTGTIAEADRVASVGIATMRQGGQDGSCYTNAAYANSGYVVETGTVTSTHATPLTFEAYRIGAAQNAATSFKAGGSALYFQFPDEGSFNVFKMSGSLIPEIVVSSIVVTNTAEFVDTNVDISGATSAAVYFVVPAATRVSAWHLSAGVERARLFVSGGVALYAERFDVTKTGATPFDAALDWNHGPSAHSHKYGTYKRFFRVINANDGEGVVWQDVTTGKVFLTWLDGSPMAELPNPGAAFLAAAASDGGAKGEVVYVLAAGGGNADKVTPAAVTGYRVSQTGATLAHMAYDTTKVSAGFNFWAFFASGAALAWDPTTNVLGMILSRTMTKGGDGLNHQGAIGVVLDGSTLAVLRNLGQFSGHSFANFATVATMPSQSGDLATTGEFIGVDLGDNYPRGINVHRFTKDSRTSKVVYEFKTKHSTSATSPSGATYDEYTAISGGDTVYYKHSNDNGVYTEIAHSGALEMSDGSLVVLFAGEKPSLDNGAVGENFNAPRNLGMVRVSADLQTVLSTGTDSTGGFYTFGGQWTAQSNTGVVWLTDLTPPASNAKSAWEAATRIKAAKVANDEIIVLYEVWSSANYKRTEIMGISKTGAVTIARATAPVPFRLTPTDEIHVDANSNIVFYGSSGVEKKLVRYVLGKSSGGTAPEGNSGTGAAPRAGASFDREASYESGEGVAFGVIALIAAVVLCVALTALTAAIAVLHVRAKFAAVSADAESGAPPTPSRTARVGGLFVAIAAKVGLLHPALDKSSPGDPTPVMWWVGWSIATLLRGVLALAAFTMWVAAAAALEKNGGLTVKDTKYGELREPALGWAVWMLLLSLFSFAHDFVALVLQAPLVVHYFLRRRTPPAWLSTLATVLKWLVEMPHATAALQLVLFGTSTITALCAGAVSKDTNGGYVYTVVLLYLSLIARVPIIIFATARLIAVLVLPLADVVASRIENQSRASLSQTMASAGAEKGGALEDAYSVTTTATVVVAMATAKWDFKAGHQTELSFAKGDRIAITDNSQSEPGWYSGYREQRPDVIGLFPFNRVVEDKA